MYALKQLAGLSQAWEAHHRSDSPDTGTNSRGKQKKKNLQNFSEVWSEAFDTLDQSSNFFSGIMNASFVQAENEKKPRYINNTG